MLLQQKLYDNNGESVKDEKSTTVWLTDSKIKVSSTDIKEPIMIFDSESEVMTLIFRDKKEYTRISKEELQDINSKLEEARKMMEARLSQLPEAQRKMMKSQMENMYGGDAPDIKYEKEASGLKVGPYSTSKYIGKQDGQIVEEIFLTPIEVLNVEEGQFDVFINMSTFISENMSSIFGNGQNGRAGAVYSETHPSFREGIPVKTINFEDGNRRSEEILDKISTIDIPSEAFDVTPGYKEIKITEKMKQDR